MAMEVEVERCGRRGGCVSMWFVGVVVLGGVGFKVGRMDGMDGCL